jgi:hypothetical protein
MENILTSFLEEQTGLVSNPKIYEREMNELGWYTIRGLKVH